MNAGLAKAHSLLPMRKQATENQRAGDAMVIVGAQYWIPTGKGGKMEAVRFASVI
jgi:hypothetical protein